MTVGAAESQPLHHGDRGIVLAADGIDPGLVARRAFDPDRLGHGEPRVAEPGDRSGGLLRETVAIVRLVRRAGKEADHHEGRGLEAGRFVAVGEKDGGPGAQSADILEIAEFGNLERQLAELLGDRDFLADGGGRKHLPHRVIGIDLARVLGNLHGDIAGEGWAGQDHRIAPHIGVAVLAVLRGIVGEYRRRSRCSRA